MDPKTQADLNNHANQLNPNNDAYQGGASEPAQETETTVSEEIDYGLEDFDIEEEWIPQEAW